LIFGHIPFACITHDSLQLGKITVSWVESIAAYCRVYY